MVSRWNECVQYFCGTCCVDSISQVGQHAETEVDSASAKKKKEKKKKQQQQQQQ